MKKKRTRSHAPLMALAPRTAKYALPIANVDKAVSQTSHVGKRNSATKSKASASLTMAISSVQRANKSVTTTAAPSVTQAFSPAQFLKNVQKERAHVTTALAASSVFKKGTTAKSKWLVALVIQS